MAPTLAYSEQKVFILGDSITHGFGLAVEDGLVNQLSNWFASEGLNITFINGVPKYLLVFISKFNTPFDSS